MSLFYVNTVFIDPSTIKLLGEEKRKGKDCYVISYKEGTNWFKQWKIVGDITTKYG